MKFAEHVTKLFPILRRSAVNHRHRLNKWPSMTCCELLEPKALLTTVLQGPEHVEDAFLTNFGGQNSDANTGGLGTLEVFRGGYRPLLQFDLASVTTGIGAATLDIYQTNYSWGVGAAAFLDVYAVSQDWEEGTGTNVFSSSRPGVSWDNASVSGGVVEWATPGGAYDTTSDFGLGANGLIGSLTLTPQTNEKWLSLDVSQVVQQWSAGTRENYGLILVERSVSSDPSQYTLAASEYSDSAFTPKLSIEEAQTVLPEISVTGSQEVGESSGTVVYTVTLSESPSVEVDVDYALVEGVALFGSDYSGINESTAQSGTFTFAKNTEQLSQSFTVSIVDDNVPESSESFSVELTNARNATLSESSSITVNVIDDDSVSPEAIVLQGPRQSIDSFLTRFNGHKTAANLGRLQTLEVFNGDYRPIIEFDVSDIAIDVGTATLDLYQTNSSYGVGAATTIDVYAVTKNWREGRGTNVFRARNGVSWDYATVRRNSARWSAAGGDYDTTSDFGNGANGLVGSLSLSPTTDNEWVSVDVTEVVRQWTDGGLANHGLIFIERTVDADPTQYTLASSEFSNRSLAPRLTVVETVLAIPEESVIPEIRISSAATVLESTSAIEFTVTLSESPSSAVTVDYSTVDGSVLGESAFAGTDYSHVSGTLTFAAETAALSRTFSVPILDDKVAELSESFSVVLSNPQHATIAEDSAIVSIVDEDEVVSGFRISDQSLNQEGNDGSQQVEVSVELLGGTSEPVTVFYRSLSATAEASVDFLATSGTLTFQPGETVKSIPVTVLGDTEFETNETFRVQLSKPDGTVDWIDGTVQIAGFEVLDGSAEITIVNDDVDTSGFASFYSEAEFNNSYLGGFLLPAGIQLSDNQKAAFTGSASSNGLAVRKNDDGSDTLFITGETEINNGGGYLPDGSNSVIAEVTIPNSFSTDPSQLETASVVSAVNISGFLETDFDGTTGSPDFAVNSDHAVRIQDFLITDNGELLVSTNLNYNPGAISHSHALIDTLDLNSVTDDNVTGLFDTTSNLSTPNLPRLDGTHAAFFSGYMTDIPTEWQPLLGGTHLMGANGANGVTSTSQGPSALIFDANSVSESDDAAAQAALYYYAGDDGPLQDTDFWPWAIQGVVADDPLFNSSSNVRDVVFVPGTRTVLFIGDNAINEDTGESYFAYGESGDFEDTARGYDSGVRSVGGHYGYQVWAYDVYDLASVIAGDANAWDIRPHDVWGFDFPNVEGQHQNKELGGAAFDPETGLFYVAQNTGGDQQIVHVYQFGSDTLVAASEGTDGADLQLPQAEIALTQAVNTLIATGLSSSDVVRLQQMQISLGDLQDSRLISVSGTAIVLDRDAASNGWSVGFLSQDEGMDSDPVGLLSSIDPLEDGTLDLLSVLLQELNSTL